jgi:hypothetical protein
VHRLSPQLQICHLVCLIRWSVCLREQ